MQFVLGFWAGIAAGFILRGLFDTFITELRHVGSNNGKAKKD